MKKIMSILMASLMLMGVLASCNETTPEDETTVAVTTTEVTTEATETEVTQTEETETDMSEPDIERTEAEQLLYEEKMASLRFFLEAVNLDKDSPGYGLVRDRYPGNPDMASIASTGFGLAALPIAVEEGLISSEDAERQAAGTLRTALTMEEQEGFLFHFVNMETAKQLPNVEYSTIDTALLIAGGFVAGEYWGGEVKELADELFRQVNWDYFVDQERMQFHMSAKPFQGFESYWDYYAEQLIMYVLGAGSPTHPIDRLVYYRFRREMDSYGSSEPFLHSWHGSIFTYQYSHAFVDFRGIEDELGARWYENSVQASIAAYDFAKDIGKEFETYREGAWGLTASDTAEGYVGPQGSRPSGNNNAEHVYNGTIATSGALGSYPFTPEYSLEAMELYASIPELQGEFGLNNAYNRDIDWYGPDTIGIDKGITALMIDNKENGLIWELFMRNEHVQRGLEVLGFTEYEFEAGE